MKKSKVKPLPKFKSETAERKFWATHSVTDYFDLASAKWTSFPNLKPSTETISLRLPLPLLNQIKSAAQKRDVPYQSLIKMLLADTVMTLHNKPSPNLLASAKRRNKPRARH